MHKPIIRTVQKNNQASVLFINTMSQSVILCFVYTGFLLLGGIIFMYLEWKIEERIIVIEPEQWIQLKEILSSSSPPENEDALTSLVAWTLDRCPHLPDDTSLHLTTPGNQSWIVEDIEERCSELHIAIKELVYSYPWKYIDAVYFSMTVATTIGYGHISPSTDIGKVVCIMYALVGVPLTGLLLAWTSSFFGEQLHRLFSSKLDAEKQRSKLFIALGTVFYIAVGFIVFIFLPAVVFIYIEEQWSYLEGVYYAFITLTTIGFGDFVSGKNLQGAWLYVYQIAVIVWILTGLGYWVMVANFISRALTSKEMHAFAKKATDVKKLMKEVGLANNDPQFLSHTSKATLNFMLQFSSLLIAPELVHKAGMPNGSAGGHHAPVGIPGIAALFGKAGMGGMGGNSLFFNPMQMTMNGASKNASSQDLPKLPKRTSSKENLLSCGPSSSPVTSELTDVEASMTSTSDGADQCDSPESAVTIADETHLWGILPSSEAKLESSVLNHQSIELDPDETTGLNKEQLYKVKKDDDKKETVVPSESDAILDSPSGEESNVQYEDFSYSIRL